MPTELPQSRQRRPWLARLSAAGTALIATALTAQVDFVKANATGQNNGSSWQDAYTCLDR